MPDEQAPTSYARRAAIAPGQLQALFALSWGATKPGYDRVLERSFTWVTAHSGEELVGFVNVAWDGGAHFFLLDTTVHPELRRRGIGRRLVAEALAACRGRQGWLHVDAEGDLMEALYRPCGFVPTAAGIIRITPS